MKDSTDIGRFFQLFDGCDSISQNLVKETNVATERDHWKLVGRLIGISKQETKPHIYVRNVFVFFGVGDWEIIILARKCQKYHI